MDRLEAAQYHVGPESRRFQKSDGGLFRSYLRNDWAKSFEFGIAEELGSEAIRTVLGSKRMSKNSLLHLPNNVKPFQQ